MAATRFTAPAVAFSLSLFLLISTGSCRASWVENSGELAPISLLKIHARIKCCLFVYNVPTDEF